MNQVDQVDDLTDGRTYHRLAEPSEVFAVHPLTGVVTLTRRLVFSENPFYEMAVLADDRGPHLQAVVNSARATVRVHVIRVNQHAPRITVSHLPQVMEQTHVDVYAVVRIDDADDGPSGQVSRLSRNSFDSLEIHSTLLDKPFRTIKTHRTIQSSKYHC